jgi:hypothetical protein
LKAAGRETVMVIKAKRRLRRGWIILAFLTLVLFNHGCGKIGDPVPPGFAVPQTITDLSAQMEKDGERQRSNSTMKDKQ